LNNEIRQVVKVFETAIHINRWRIIFCTLSFLVAAGYVQAGPNSVSSQTSLTPSQLKPLPIPIAKKPLVVTVRNSYGAALGRGFKVCVGTKINHQEYGMMFNNDNGQASFADVPMLGPILISVEPMQESNVRYGAEVELNNIGNQDVDVQVQPNWQARCPGVAQRIIPRATGRPGIIGTLRHSGGLIVPSRRVQFFTTSAGANEPYVEVTGRPTEFRTFEAPLWSGWQSLNVTNGNQARLVTHDIRGGNGSKSIRVQFRNSALMSEEYQVGFDFVELYFCELTYQRANTAFAPKGVPEGNLGEEDVRVMIGETKSFDTSWPSPNENKRGYGMHLRTAKNKGTQPIEIKLRLAGVSSVHRIEPGFNYSTQADLLSVRCP
jgi:hypothetical protein